ncbi:hypothetical protein AGMMS49960_02560 [Betaproteobacteria bacterium]|nr:hypothetical protein AGMMS49543_24880 [Betaproteobacteria bacterium]GHT98788.1 hypothetical protein AGMMS49960_02560 [Betaproteobacteria bacterium]GHU18528.1 hypothetical protein AGMMS50243_08710 [Betaproteobacteria bacterium]
MPKPQRRVVRSIAPKLHIFCEGEKTEPDYFRHYLSLKDKESLSGSSRDPVVVIEQRKKNTPVQLVEEAVDKKKNYLEGDEVWVVYDRESEGRYPDSLHAKARKKADANGVRIALSNVCFEFWLLLHFEYTAAAYNSCDQLLENSKLARQHIPNYEKGKARKYSDKEIEMARKNAVRLNQQTMNGADPAWTQPHQWNPYTDVYKLLDAIDAWLSEA